jgi:hypothetical protein
MATNSKTVNTSAAALSTTYTVTPIGSPSGHTLHLYDVQRNDYRHSTFPVGDEKDERVDGIYHFPLHYTIHHIALHPTSSYYIPYHNMLTWINGCNKRRSLFVNE